MAGKPAITKAAVRLHLFCIFLALGSLCWGYNVGILSSVLVHPGFVEQLNHPNASKKGIITAIYYVGTWTSYVFLSRPASDYLGRRLAGLAGIVVLCFGGALIAGATGSGAFAMVIAGRIFGGMGSAVVSTSIPMFQSEVAPAKQRGRFVVMNHVGFVAGLATGFWVGYAVTFWDSPRGVEVGWRFSIAVQFIPAFIFAVGLPFVHESPRWLVEHGKIDSARTSLHYFREGSFTNDEIETELADIQQSLADYRASGLTWLSLFREPTLFARLWRAALLQFMAQMCGATAMKYYLPTLFRALGLPTRLALLAGGIESTLKIGCAVLEMLIIDRVGRRLCLAIGAAVMAFAMLINGALPLVYPGNVNRASDYACIVFIFIYALGYSVGFGPAAWVYGAEIFPTSLRARGLNFAASGGAIGSIAVAQIWPVGIDRIGSRIYFFFMAVNLACVPVIYLLYPETKGFALEDMDGLFGGAGGRARLRGGRRGEGEGEGYDEDAVAFGEGGQGGRKGLAEPAVLGVGRAEG
ncbi:general substrate transporter [Phialemonium atrogriseum]|uniref:General substrate transporter n=1 Tax=Phialemonium atrogriseum TaxID=1093897 RepID=A0AAJ0FGS1_9PEZI|nr:general substrate transporter [Phialemonium atrogriseum]KAK1767891.1 general substrate transporter [Phialemonium atrogriseum]